MTRETYRVLATTDTGINMDTLLKSKSLRETSNNM